MTFQTTDIDLVVDGGDDPGQTETHENVHRVAPRHVPDGVVRCLLGGGGDLAGEGVGERRPQCHECDGRDLNIEIEVCTSYGSHGY